jgi:hypothetical protein
VHCSRVSTELQRNVFRDPWRWAVAILGILLIRYRLLAIVLTAAIPFVLIPNLLGDSGGLPTFPWNFGEILVPAWASPGEGKGPVALLVAVHYAGLYYWVVFAPRRTPLPAMVLDLAGRGLGAVAASLKAIPIPRRIQARRPREPEGFRVVQAATERSALEFFALVVLSLLLIKYLLVGVASAVAFPIMLLFGLVTNSIRTMPWDAMVPAWLITGVYVALWKWRRISSTSRCRTGFSSGRCS